LRGLHFEQEPSQTSAYENQKSPAAPPWHSHAIVIFSGEHIAPYRIALMIRIRNIATADVAVAQIVKHDLRAVLLSPSYLFRQLQAAPFDVYPIDRGILFVVQNGS